MIDQAIAAMADLQGRVATSSAVNVFSASSRELPHIDASGRNDAQNAGRSGLPNKRQR